MNLDIRQRLLDEAHKDEDKDEKELTTATGTKTRFTDADTTIYGENNTRGRLKGFDARETTKYQPDRLYGEQDWTTGEALAEEETKVISEYAKNNGFNTVVEETDADGNILKDYYGRNIIDYKDDDGNTLSSSIIQSGGFASPGSKFTDKNYYLTQISGRLDDYQDVEKLRGKGLALNAVDQELREIIGLGQQRQVAENEAEYVQGLDRDKDFNPIKQQLVFKEGMVRNRSYKDRDLYNQAKNNTYQHLKEAFRGISEGYYGGYNLFGELLDNDKLKAKGEEGIEWVEAIRANAPEYAQVELFDPETGEWTPEGLGETLNQVGYLAAGSLPYLLGSIGLAATGAGLVAAAGGGALASLTVAGVSTLPSALVYSGQTYEGQKGEHDPVLALKSGISQSVLERVAIPIGLGNVFSKVGFGKLVNQISKSRKIKVPEAKKIALSAISKETAKAVGGLAIAGSREAITEAGQEALAIWGENNPEAFEKEFENRIKTGAVAGGILGSSLSGVGKGASALHQAYGQTIKDQVDKSGRVFGRHSEVAEEKRKQDSEDYGAPLTNEEQAQLFKADEKSQGDLLELTQGETGIKTSLKRGPRRLVQSAADFAFTGNAMKAPEIQALASIFGAGTAQTGLNYQTAPQAIFARIAGFKEFDKRNMAGFNKLNVKVLNQFMGDKAKVRQARKDMFQGKDVQLEPVVKDFLNQVEASNAIASREAGRKVDLLEPVINPAVAVKNSVEFQELFKDQGFSKTEAARAYKIITELRDPISSLEPKIDDAEADLDATLLKAVQADAFKKFHVNDPIEAVQVNSRAIAKRVARNRFIGENGEVPSKAISQAVNSGVISKAEGHQIARDVKEIIEAQEGLRKRPSKIAGALLNTASTLAQILYLPLVVVSSIIDVAPTFFKDVDIKQWFTNLDEYGNQFGKEIAKEINAINDLYYKNIREDDASVRLAQAGFNDEAANAAQRVDAEITAGFTEKFSNFFFKVNMLEGWNRMMRAKRLAIGQSSIRYYSLLYLSKNDSDTPSDIKMKQRAEDVLTELGFDLAALKHFATISQNGETWYLNEGKNNQIEITAKEAEDAKRDVMNSWNDASIEFTNRAILNPRTLNRPLLFSAPDPFMRMFTQFQGFSSVMTSKFIPQTIKTIKKGTAGERAGVAAMLASMVGLAYLSLAIKSAIKDSDKDDKDEDKPIRFKVFDDPYAHIDGDWNKLLRLFQASGLLGTTQIVTDLFHSPYGDFATSANPLDASPAINVVKEIYKSGKHFSDEDRPKQYDKYRLKNITPPLSGLGERGNRASQSILDTFYGGNRNGN